MVGHDDHVRVDDHFYSVPYVLCREEVEVRLTASTVEVFHPQQPRGVARAKLGRRSGTCSSRRS